MSTLFDIIEYERPEFFKAASLADYLIRMSLLNVDEFTTAVETAAQCLDELRRAYTADLERMAAILERLQDRKSIEGL